MIFSTHPLHPDVARDLAALGQLRVATTPTPDAIAAQSAGAGIIVVRAPIDPAIIRRESGLRACVRHGAGLDMIPVDVATQAGVLVANLPGANAVTVAEHVIWSSMALLRRHIAVHTDFRAGGWEAARANADTGRDMSGRTLGIVGFGNVGKALARIATGGFDMRVLVHSRSAPASVPLPDLLAHSDIVALCCPLTDETRGLIGATQLGQMPSRAILVNVARGPVVDEAALIEALTSGNLGGAVLDVFDQQPLSVDHPFLSMPNVILTPHMAGITEESMLRMGQGVVVEVARILGGEMPLNFINPDATSRYRDRFG